MRKYKRGRKAEEMKKGEVCDYDPKKKLLELSFKAYEMLKEDEEYKLQWDSLEKLKKEVRKKCRESSSDDEIARALMSVTDLTRKIKEKWKLSEPISPYLKLKKEDLFKPVRPKSSLAKFIYAFGIDTNPELLKSKQTMKTVSERTIERETKFKKFFCYSMISKDRSSCRRLARMYKVDKKTVKKWADEVESWSETERKIVSNEMLTGKYSPNMDVLRLSKHFKTQFSKVEYGVTPEGMFKTGRKSKHEASYEPKEED